MAEVSEFHINNEYQNLIPPLTPQEFNELKESIKNNGQRLRVTISDRTGQLVIVDGHHRYKACKELGIEPKYIVCLFISVGYGYFRFSSDILLFWIKFD